MRRIVTCAAVLFIFAALAAHAGAATLYLEPKTIDQGQPALVKACLEKGVEQARAWFMGRYSGLVKGGDGCFYGVVAADLKAKAGKQPLRVFVGKKQVVAAEVSVAAKDYGARRISVAKKFMKLTPGQIERYKREMAQIKAAYEHYTPERLWKGAFIRPLDSVVVSPFGRRSIVNGQEKSPHGGVDLRGKTGTPVMASASGRVALVLDTFFGGLLVIIDHGQGLVSKYIHLSAALVKKGQEVQKGQIIGRVGATGRVTGPHLDFSVRLGGARVDPLAWIELSKKLAGKLDGNKGQGG